MVGAQDIAETFEYAFQINKLYSIERLHNLLIRHYLI